MFNTLKLNLVLIQELGGPGGRGGEHLTADEKERQLERNESVELLHSSLSTLTAFLIGGAIASPPPKAPPQLNITSFANCLRARLPAINNDEPLDLATIHDSWNLTATDGLLVYVSLYAGKRLPVLNATVQEPAYKRWALRFERQGAALARALRARTDTADTPVLITPADVFADGLAACGGGGGGGGGSGGDGEDPSAAAFCALVAGHNVLRALGRPDTYTDRNGKDYLPAWYKSDVDGWAAAARAIRARLFPLRRDGPERNKTTNATVPGQPWGSWYHLFGLALYTVHEAAVLPGGLPSGAAWAALVARLNQILNPLFAGGTEDPAKAAIDRDAVRVAAAFAAGGAEDGAGGGACDGPAGYVLPRTYAATADIGADADADDAAVQMWPWPKKKPSPNVPCKSMREYMPPAASASYDMAKHNGTWYEVSFRDLYPWGPLCDCQQSIKYVNEKQGYIDDYFVFTCYPAGWNYISPQRENVTDAATGARHENGLYDMYVRHSDFKMLTKYEWNTEMIGFHDDGQDQYKWVIEFQCGTRPHLPKLACLGHLASDGECYFTGVQLYVRDLENVDEGRAEMIAYLKGLGPNATRSLGVAWVMDDFGPGTFPPWFKNVTENPKCPRPCAHGVYNATTGMWGCPSEHKGVPLRVASPLGDPYASFAEPVPLVAA